MKSNRNYKRGEAFRDARLFVIACEGALREKAYFEHLCPLSPRLRVEIISPQNEENDNVGNSSPNWVLERVVKFVEKEGINIKNGDRIWFVLDVDRWGKALYDIQAECQKNNWQMALSNPCFEVWLWLHFRDIVESKAVTCKEFKAEIHQEYEGGYKVDIFTKPEFYELAQQRAKKIDTESGFMPNPKTTKVYLLLNDLFEILA